MLSTSHEIPTPAIATDPSKKYAGLASGPSWKPTVVSRPFCEYTGSCPVLSSVKHPVPYVILLSPLESAQCPKIAADWSPRHEAIGTPSSSVPLRVPYFSAELLIGGSMLIGIPSLPQISSSQSHVLRLISMVRAALDTSVTCTPPESEWISHESIVPKAASPWSAFSLISGTFSSNHLSFTPEKYVLIGRPHRRRKASGPPCWSERPSQIPEVRVSSHTSALCRGLPVLRSHTMVVSLWLVTPTALMSAMSRPFS
mmetsp:Transcript_8813/g.22024  ORF Transcript_8813/g.22024 Transcript_8813/m.22024 type:complete len:256 (+) Transcript_8813:773-1540(+)